MKFEQICIRKHNQFQPSKTQYLALSFHFFKTIFNPSKIYSQLKNVCYSCTNQVSSIYSASLSNYHPGSTLNRSNFIQSEESLGNPTLKMKSWSPTPQPRSTLTWSKKKRTSTLFESQAYKTQSDYQLKMKLKTTSQVFS